MRVAAFITAFISVNHNHEQYLTQLDGKCVVQHAYESAVNTGLFATVTVLTNDDNVQQALEGTGAIYKKANYKNSNCIECVAAESMTADADIIMHIQGNVPYVHEAPLVKLLQTFEDTTGKNIHAASLVYKMMQATDIADINKVKAVLDLRLFAIYFSRYPVPYLYNTELPITHYGHIGIAAYRHAMLLNVLSWPVAPLERTEQIDILRLIENGIQVKMLIAQQPVTEITHRADTGITEPLGQSSL